MILWKFSADKGGGSWKFIVNPVNVDKPQSLSHVQPICEFTANDTRDNMRAAMFSDDSPHRADVEDICHRRCMLLTVKVGGHIEVAVVKNSNPSHHRHRPMPLTSDYVVSEYTVAFPQQSQDGKSFDNRVATVDFKSVKTIMLMFNKTLHRFDRLSFVDTEGTSLGSSTMKSSIYCACETLQKFELLQYLLA